MLISFLALYVDVFEPPDYKAWAACTSPSSGTLSLIWEVLSIVVTTEMDKAQGGRGCQRALEI